MLEASSFVQMMWKKDGQLKVLDHDELLNVGRQNMSGPKTDVASKHTEHVVSPTVKARNGDGSIRNSWSTSFGMVWDGWTVYQILPI